MAHTFYPFVEHEKDLSVAHSAQTPLDSQQPHDKKPHVSHSSPTLEPMYGARIAVVDTPFAAPRVVVVDPQDTRSYLEEITQTVSSLAQKEGSVIPFMVIREIVENFIHAYFKEPTISILNHGNIIRFSDQGPGIPEKEKAFSFGTTSATREMKQYIRGVGSGLPYVKAYMEQTHGYISVEDNISGGCIVTLYAHKEDVPHAQNEHMGDISNQSNPELPTLFQETAYQAYNNTMQSYPYQGGYTPQTPPSQRYIPPQHAYTAQAIPHTLISHTSAPYIPPYPQSTTTQATTTQSAAVGRVDQTHAQFPSIYLSERAKMILCALRDTGSIGPSELCRMYGLSQPTWSRELKSLEDLGMIHKAPKEQKRTLTTLGSSFLRNIAEEL